MSAIPSRYRRRGSDPSRTEASPEPFRQTQPPQLKPQSAAVPTPQPFKPSGPQVRGQYVPQYRGHAPPAPPQALPRPGQQFAAPPPLNSGQFNGSPKLNAYHHSRGSPSPLLMASPSHSPMHSPMQSPLQSPTPSPAPMQPLHSQSSDSSLKSSRRLRVNTDPATVSVRVRLMSREVIKRVRIECTASQFADAIVREHRLELDNDVSEADAASDTPSTAIVWEHIDGTRRPLRASETIGRVCARWEQSNSPTTSSAPAPPPSTLGQASDMFYLRLTGTALRDRVDSVASLVPRRDMLRQSPELNDSDVHFFVAHTRQRSSDWVGGGAISLANGILVVRRNNAVVCRMHAADADVYEWPHVGPAKYVLVLRNHSKALYLSTDSAKTFSIVRNAVYTARTQALFGRTAMSPSA